MSISPRRRQVRRTVAESSTTDRPSGSAVPVEEGLLTDPDTLPKPDGFGTEDSRSAQSFAVLDAYEVPAGHVAKLQELSVSIEGNGAAKISVAGTTYGPYTGAVDVSVPLEGAVLTPGYQIRVHHQSTDGNATTTKATAVVLEV